MITIVPTAGLCNRMRAINGAAALAERAGVQLRVVWWATWDLNAPFDRLFATDGLDFELVERRVPGRAGAKVIDGEEQFRALVPRGALVVRAADTHPDSFDPEPLVAAASTGTDIWIRSMHKVADHPRPFSMFAPSAEVQSLLDGVPALRSSADDASSRPVGVHVRRTDSTQSIAKSPMSAFEQLMDNELVENPDQRFFVATDDRASYEHLEQRYGAAVSEYTKRSYARDDLDGVVDAAVDFWGLTRCRKIIGSFYSSFTETAAATGGADLVMALDG